MSQLKDFSVAIFVDAKGWETVAGSIPVGCITSLVASSIRPQYTQSLEAVAKDIGARFLVQPRHGSEDFQKFRNNFMKEPPDLILSVSYSLRIPVEILEIARLGGLNIHYGLLPRSRGRHPLQWALIGGEHFAGVTLHEMSDQIDHGAIVDQYSVPINFVDTWVSLTQKLDPLAESIIRQNWNRISTGQWVSVLQNESEATYGLARTEADSEVTLTMPVIDIYNKVRALVPPLPPAFLQTGSGQLKFDRLFKVHEIVELKNRAGHALVTGEWGFLNVTMESRPGFTFREDGLVNFEVFDGSANHVGYCQIRTTDDFLKEAEVLCYGEYRRDEVFLELERWAERELRISALNFARDSSNFKKAGLR